MIEHEEIGAGRKISEASCDRAAGLRDLIGICKVNVCAVGKQW